MDAIKNTKYCIPLSILQKVRLVHPVKKNSKTVISGEKEIARQ